MKILIVAGGGMGDILMTTPMFRALKLVHPKVSISVLIVQSINAHLLERNPYIDEIIDWNQFSGENRKLIRFLKEKNFSHAIHNHSCPRWRFYLIPFLARIPNRFGFDRTSTGKGIKTFFQKGFLTSHVAYRTKTELRTRMNLNILELLGVKNEDISYDLHLEKTDQVDSNRIGMHPGSDGRGAIKRWPAKSFMALAKQLVAEHGKKVAFYIGPAEKELKDVIRPENGIEILECASLAELVKDMSKCSSFVSNDSGLSHISAALQIPTTVLFGPTQPDEYRLPTRNINICVSEFDCTTCFREKKCLHSAPTCLKTLNVNEVMHKHIELMNKTVLN